MEDCDYVHCCCVLLALYGLKNARISSAKSLGSSMAVKCPPLGIVVKRVIFRLRLDHSFGGSNISAGKRAKPVGTSIRLIGGLEDINPLNNNRAKYFYNIKLTAEAYMCNMAVCKDKDSDDAWYIANNLDNPTAIREYKKKI